MGSFGSGGGYGKPQIKFGGPITPIVKILMIANVAVFLFLMIPAMTANTVGRLSIKACGSDTMDPPS